MPWSRDPYAELPLVDQLELTAFELRLADAPPSLIAAVWTVRDLLAAPSACRPIGALTPLVTALAARLGTPPPPEYGGPA